jgi:hypothetical protein
VLRTTSANAKVKYLNIETTPRNKEFERKVI